AIPTGVCLGRFRKWRSSFFTIWSRLSQAPKRSDPGLPLAKIRPMAHERTAELSASPPMFESRFLDFFSRVHPAVPAIVFIPVVVAGIWVGIDRGLAVWTTVLLFLAGIGIWTLTEYWLHRLLFHWQPKFRGGDRLHFIIHGVHHDHPNDAMRLVMPPAASIPLAAIFFAGYMLIFGSPAAYPLFAGLIIGYLFYDYTHYYLH